MLVIIDMQEGHKKEFDRQYTTSSSVIKKIANAIKVSKLNNDYIVTMVMPLDGLILPELKKELKDYPRWINIPKKFYDGSKELYDRITELNLKPNTLELCGAFANVCVYKTYEGIRGFNLQPAPKIRINYEQCIYAPFVSKIRNNLYGGWNVGRNGSRYDLYRR